MVAVNIDRGGADKPKSFLAETGATHLSLYTDPTGKLFSKLKAVGMPTTLLSTARSTRSGAWSARPIGICQRRSP